MFRNIAEELCLECLNPLTEADDIKRPLRAHCSRNRSSSLARKPTIALSTRAICTHCAAECMTNSVVLEMHIAANCCADHPQHEQYVTQSRGLTGRGRSTSFWRRPRPTPPRTS